MSFLMLHINITKRLDRFSLEIALDIDVPGIAAVFGPSGSGKSTFAKILAGLCAPDGGQIFFNEMVFFDGAAGVNLPHERRGVGFLFQEHRLFPHMNVFKNLSFGCFAGDRTPCCDIAEIARIFGIDHLLRRSPSSLSGWESQRAALARAILAAENFIIMDEPLSSLDDARREDLMAYIERIPPLFGIPIIYITHSREEVTRLAQRVILIEEGRVTGCCGPSKLLKKWEHTASRQNQKYEGMDNQ